MGWTISRYVFLGAWAASAGLLTARTAAAAPVINGQYYEENASVGCGVSNGCTLPFTAVPAGKRLLITRISCAITEANDRIVSVALGRRSGSGVQRDQYLNVTLISGVAGLRRFVVSQETSLLLGAGVQPGIELVTDLSGASSFTCQIIGQLSGPGS